MATPLTVLLVEDSALMRQLLADMLRPAEFYSVLEAAEGGAALDVLHRQPVDLVLADWNMNPVNGLQLFRSMRADPGLAAIPFVLMTGDHTPERAVQAIQAGVNAFLAKPFGRDQLSKAVAMALGQAA